jgi:hypothetical protein
MNEMRKLNKRPITSGTLVMIGVVIFCVLLYALRQVGIPVKLFIIISLPVFGIPLSIISRLADKYSKEVGAVILSGGYKIEADYNKIMEIINREAIFVDPDICKRYVKYQAIGMILGGYFLSWMIVICLNMMGVVQ